MSKKSFETKTASRLPSALQRTPLLTGHLLQRLILAGIVCVVAGLLGYGYYLQFVKYLDPCPLCLTQRFFYMAAGVVALTALIRVRRMLLQKICAALIALFALAGLATATRQVWLQHLPPEKVPECGPGLQYWLENMPLLDTARLLFAGDGNCAEVHWRFLGLSIAGWSIVMFTALLGTGIWLYRCERRLGLNTRTADCHELPLPPDPTIEPSASRA